MGSLRWRTRADEWRHLTYVSVDGQFWRVIIVPDTHITWVHWLDFDGQLHMNRKVGKYPEFDKATVRNILLSLQKYEWMFIDPMTPKHENAFRMPLVKED